MRYKQNLQYRRLSEDEDERLLHEHLPHPSYATKQGMLKTSNPKWGFCSYTICCSDSKAEARTFRFVVLKAETMRTMLHKAVLFQISWQWCRWVYSRPCRHYLSHIQCDLAISLSITFLNVSNVTKHMPQRSRFRRAGHYFQRDFHVNFALHKHLR